METLSQTPNIRYLSIYVLGTLWAACLSSISYAYTENDQFLKEQHLEIPAVSEELILQVKEEAQKPVKDQLHTHHKMAQVQAETLQKENLEQNVVHDYELKRKTDPAKLTDVKRHEYVPAKTSNVIYSIGYENKNVIIGNKNK